MGGPGSGRRPMPEKKIQGILRAFKSGKSLGEIAKKAGVTPQRIGQIIREHGKFPNA